MCNDNTYVIHHWSMIKKGDIYTIHTSQILTAPITHSYHRITSVFPTNLTCQNAITLINIITEQDKHLCLHTYRMDNAKIVGL